MKTCKRFAIPGGYNNLERKCEKAGKNWQGIMISRYKELIGNIALELCTELDDFIACIY